MERLVSVPAMQGVTAPPDVMLGPQLAAGQNLLAGHGHYVPKFTPYIGTGNYGGKGPGKTPYRPIHNAHGSGGTVRYTQGGAGGWARKLPGKNWVTMPKGWKPPPGVTGHGTKRPGTGMGGATKNPKRELFPGGLVGRTGAGRALPWELHAPWDSRNPHLVSMPYSRRTSRGMSGRSYGVGRWGIRRAGHGVRATASKELKFLDTALGLTPLTGAAAMTGMELNPNANADSVNGVQQGAGDSQRIGKSIRLVSLEISGVVEVRSQNAQTTGDVTPEIRLWIVLDKNSNANPCSSENVLTNPTGSTATVTQAVPNLLFQQRFRILKSIVVKFPVIPVHEVGGTGLQAGVHKAFKMKVNLGNLGMTFTSSVPTFAGIQANGLNILGCTSAGTSANELQPGILYNARLRYTE